MAFLADTHAFLWFVFDDARLSARAEELMSGGDAFALSIASLWEIGIKTSIDKLRLGMSYQAFVETCVTNREVRVLPVGILHLIEYANLPMHHRDPFDRLLIAQSRRESLTIITADPRFGDYDVDVVW